MSLALTTAVLAAPASVEGAARGRGLRLLALAGMALLAGCAAPPSAGLSLRERLQSLPVAGLPITAPITVRWNDHHVPFIEAESDDDLAFALGLVHAHLRIGQMTLLRRIAQGRLAESAGPLAVELDHALRLLNPGAAAAEMEALLPAETRRWLGRYVDGINAWQAAQPGNRRPREFRWLGLAYEPWTTADVLRLSRLAGADVNWFAYLQAVGEPDAPAFWSRLLQAGGGFPEIRETADDRARLFGLLGVSSRSGSNSVVVSGRRSASGGGLIASDPHLGLSLPNFWVLVGARSPSYEVVGMMVPGLPFWGLGRNPRLAWGGTNLRAASSDLIDVSELPADAFESREEVVRVRGWRTVRRTVRTTRYGPVITDAKLLRAPAGRVLALQWMGHRASDEITPFLRAARASHVGEFRAAWTGYAVSGQTMLAADDRGGIARVLAVTLPDQARGYERGPWVKAGDPRAEWGRFAGPDELPATIDPAEGVLVSANDAVDGGAVSLGFFFSPGGRADRLRELAARSDRVSAGDLANWQRDTASAEALALAGLVVAEVRRLPEAIRSRHAALIGELASWTGNYEAKSRGAVVFEAVLGELVPRVYGAGPGERLPGGLDQWNQIVAFLPGDLRALAAADRERVLGEALTAAAGTARRYSTWGEMHRLRVAHLLGNLPVLGGRWVVTEFGADGSRNTVHKTNHDLVRGRHRAGYGSQSRHISDLADPDENHFVLLGGNDGWWGSDGFADQVALWREGATIRLPLRPESVRREFPTVVQLGASAMGAP